MENTKNMIIPVVLKGPNYLLWARTARMILCSKGMWRHIVSSQPIGEDISGDEGGMVLAEDSKWFQEDQTVLAILTSSLDAHLIEAYSFCDTAKQLWDTLKKVFGNVSNLTRVYEVKKAINTLNQEEMEFSAYFGKLSSLWAELDMLRPGTSDPLVIKERQQQDRVFKLLGGLNANFNDLTKHILRQERVPNVDEVCSQILKEQGSHGLVSKGDLVTANQVEQASAHKVSLSYEERRRLVCEHCKRKGHSKDRCWILHPHLKPNKFKEQKANLTQSVTEGDQAGTSKVNETVAMKAAPEDDIMRKSDVEKLLKSIASLKDLGITYFSQKPADSLIIDSGASHHMISNPRLIGNLEPAVGNVVVANGTKVPIRGVGDLRLFEKTSKAFYMPNFTSNLLSVKKATTDLDCWAIFGSNSVHFQDTKSGKILGEGGTKDGLYVLGDAVPSSLESLPFTANSVVALNSVWHARLGHPHARAIELMLPNVKFDPSVCEACILGKHCKSVFSSSSTIYENCFDLIHSDVWTAPCTSRDNLKYFVTFIDEKSKYTWITLLPSKDRVFDAFLNFQNYVTNQFNAKIKVLRSDNGGEYTSIKFKEHLSKHGIKQQTSCPYTPQQNGVAERKNRHLMEVARSMMFHANVPRRFWGDAVMTACYLINRTPTKVLKDISPFEVLNGIKPSLEHLRVFGCVCFVLIPGELRNKLDPKSNRCMFIGYSTTQKGYKCIDPTNGKTYVSRDVKFIEEKGYYDKIAWDELKDLAHSTMDRSSCLRHLLEHLGLGKENASPNSQPTSPEPSSSSPVEPPLTTSVEPPLITPLDSTSSNINASEMAAPNDASESTLMEEPLDRAENEGETVVAQPLRRSTRLRKDPSNWVNTRVYYNNQAVSHPTQSVCSITLLPADHQAFLGKIEMHYIPKSYEEAKDIKEWCEAIGAEVSAMEKNHTWEETDLPKGKKAVSSKWVFTIKYHSNGDIERYKARLVARGFTQTYGEDYTDTFAPVAKLHTVRVVLSLATNLSWELWQMDVKNAFLQGELEEEVYMHPPPGLENSFAPGKVLKLRKAIYGLKQSPRAWYHKLSSTLKTRGFRKSEADHTLFTLQSSRGIIVVLIYVDDLIISGNDKSGIAETKAFLKSVFDIKDLGELKYFLGIEVCRSSEGLFLSQRKYVIDLLTETGTLGAKPAKTPLEDGYKVARKGEKDDTPYAEPAQYRRLVGKLIYLTITRPDLCFAVNQVSQHMQTPTVYHWSMVARILRYLKGSPGRGIWMGKNENTEIAGYCDADWAGDRNDRKSTTGYCTFIGGNLVTWKTKKQKVVSCSSAEAEYRAMRKLTNELTWLKALLMDLGIESSKPIIMHCDNQAAIHIASNSVFHERTKHIEIDCHKVREKIEEGVTLPCYTKSEDQLADIFTKAASLKVCEHISNKLGLVDLTRP